MVEHSRPGLGPVTPDGLSLLRHDEDLPGARVVDQEDVPVREHLRVGGILDAWRLRRPVKRAVPAHLAHPGAENLGGQDVAVGKRRVPIWQAKALWRIVGAIAGPTELRLDGLRLAIDEDQAAVSDVGHPDAAVWPHVGVVRTVEIALAPAEVLVHAVLPHDPVA